jgi:hypothetical protein
MQEITSADTSLNQVPALAKLLVEKDLIKNGQVLLDYGAGKYSKTRDFFQGTLDITYLPFDPYNGSEEANKAALRQKADVVMLSNVLNVVKEASERFKILGKIKATIKPGGRLYVRTYQAPKTDLYKDHPVPGQPTKSGTCWQNCQPISFYENEIKEVFNNIRVKFGVIIAWD